MLSDCRWCLENQFKIRHENKKVLTKCEDPGVIIYLIKYALLSLAISLVVFLFYFVIFICFVFTGINGF